MKKNTEKYTIDELPEYYYVPLKCVNCGSKFVDDDPEYYSDSMNVHYKVMIKKGIKIADTKCPICGCQTLARWYK